MIPEMLNLLGCKELCKSFKNMNYKIKEEKNEIYFRYIPKK